MKTCDLHCHSVFSDGTCSPEELIELACSAGLSGLALTDHNTAAGNDRLSRAARGRLEVLSGCEFSTEAYGQELHLLGLFSESAELSGIKTILEEQLARKAESNRLTIERLAKAGYPLSYEEFLSFAGAGSKNRVHIARYMIRKGIVSEISEALDKFLSPCGNYYRESKKLNFFKMIPLIAEAGGVSVWAHPLCSVEKAACEGILREAAGCGLDGAEVYYSTYSDEDTSFMTDLCEKYGLLQSGGSDFHGENKPSIRLGVGCGDLCVPYALFEGLRHRISERMR